MAFSCAAELHVEGKTDAVRYERENSASDFVGRLWKSFMAVVQSGLPEAVSTAGERADFDTRNGATCSQ